MRFALADLDKRTTAWKLNQARFAAKAAGVSVDVVLAAFAEGQPIVTWLPCYPTLVEFPAGLTEADRPRLRLDHRFAPLDGDDDGPGAA